MPLSSGTTASVPRRNLNADAQPWGRTTDARIDQAEQNVQSVALDVNNSLAGIASTVKALSATVTGLAATQADLAKRLTYTAANAGFSNFWTSTTGNIALGMSISFTLTEQRKVYTRGMMSVTLSISSASSTTLSTSMTINGIPASITGAQGLSSVGAAGILVGSTVYVEDTQILPAGSYTITATGEGSRGGTVSSINSSFTSPSLYVQVLEAA